MAQTVDKKLFSPRRGRIALSANERIAEFLDFAIQVRFAYVNKLSHSSPEGERMALSANGRITEIPDDAIPIRLGKPISI